MVLGLYSNAAAGVALNKHSAAADAANRQLLPASVTPIILHTRMERVFGNIACGCKTPKRAGREGPL